MIWQLIEGTKINTSLKVKLLHTQIQYTETESENQVSIFLVKNKITHPCNRFRGLNRSFGIARILLFSFSY